MEIVAINERDWEYLKKIRLESLKDSPDAFGISYDEVKNFSPNDWRFVASGEAGPRFLIAYSKERALGLIGGVYSNGEYELVSMWVNPAVRGLGVGLKLVKALQSHALSEGYLSVALKVSIANKAARYLYLKAGFLVVGEAGALYGNYDIKLQRMVWHHTAKP